MPEPVKSQEKLRGNPWSLYEREASKETFVPLIASATGATRITYTAAEAGVTAAKLAIADMAINNREIGFKIFPQSLIVNGP